MVAGQVLSWKQHKYIPRAELLPSNPCKMPAHPARGRGGDLGLEPAHDHAERGRVRIREILMCTCAYFLALWSYVSDGGGISWQYGSPQARTSYARSHSLCGPCGHPIFSISRNPEHMKNTMCKLTRTAIEIHAFYLYIHILCHNLPL